MLIWDEPPKARTTEEHNQHYVADGAPPGVYVPNMPREWQEAWKAKKIGGKDPRVEIRKSCVGERHYAQVLLVMRPGGKLQMSMNGKAEMQSQELISALIVAREALGE